MQKIVPCLWFNFNAEEAVDFYLSIFPEGKKGNIARYPENSPGPAGAVMTIEFELFGQKYVALNGGPQFPFTDAVSFMVNCKDQAEIDQYWEKLQVGGGYPEQCGWLRDRFGVPWQIVWGDLVSLWAKADKPTTERVMQAMLKMVKLDIAGLKRAAAG